MTRVRRRAIAGGMVLVALAVVARRTLLVVRVDGSSMLPTYADGDRLLAVRPALTRPIRENDVVVVLAPAPSTETLVKRVTRVEAEPTSGRVFLAGDNGPSYDSRVFGALPLDAVIGRVVRVISTG